MGRQLCVLFSFLFTLTLSAQDYSDLDRRVKNYPQFSSPEHLAIRISNDFSRDRDRVRAAFVWITENIDYVRTKDDFFSINTSLIYLSPYGREFQIRKYHQKRVQKAFDFKKGYCLDYSLILDHLCRRFGLTSQVIEGLAKTEINDDEGKTFIKNHTWNAIYLNGEWLLMDATWARGYYNPNTQAFVRHTDHYFFTRPEDFAKTHYPADASWQLLDHPISQNDFLSAPIFFPNYFKSSTKISPETKGILEVSNRHESSLEFDYLKNKNNLSYRLQGDVQVRKLKVKKEGKTYKSWIKFGRRMRFAKLLTLFEGNTAILNFKVRPYVP